MFYVKDKSGNRIEINSDWIDGNVYGLCPDCGREVHVDLAGVIKGDDDLSAIGVYCDECGKQHTADRWQHVNTGIVDEGTDFDQMDWRYTVCVLSKGVDIGELARFKHEDVANLFTQMMAAKYPNIGFVVDDLHPAHDLEDVLVSV